jgi:hypothetical protein
MRATMWATSDRDAFDYGSDSDEEEKCDGGAQHRQEESKDNDTPVESGDGIKKMGDGHAQHSQEENKHDGDQVDSGNVAEIILQNQKNFLDPDSIERGKNDDAPVEGGNSSSVEKMGDGNVQHTQKYRDNNDGSSSSNLDSSTTNSSSITSSDNKQKQSNNDNKAQVDSSDVEGILQKQVNSINSDPNGVESKSSSNDSDSGSSDSSSSTSSKGSASSDAERTNAIGNIASDNAVQKYYSKEENKEEGDMGDHININNRGEHGQKDQDDKIEETFADGEDVNRGWVAYTDNNNSIFYYHNDIRRTQWEYPKDEQHGIDNNNSNDEYDDGGIMKNDAAKLKEKKRKERTNDNADTSKKKKSREQTKDNADISKTKKRKELTKDNANTSKSSLLSDDSTTSSLTSVSSNNDNDDNTGLFDSSSEDNKEDGDNGPRKKLGKMELRKKRKVEGSAKKTGVGGSKTNNSSTLPKDASKKDTCIIKERIEALARKRAETALSSSGGKDGRELCKKRSKSDVKNRRNKQGKLRER